MAGKNKKSTVLSGDFVKGVLFSAVTLIALIFVANTLLRNGSFRTSGGDIFAGKGGGGKTQGNYDSSNFNFPEDAGSVLLNTSFETNVDQNILVPDNWTYHYDQPNTNTGVRCNVAKTGNCSYYINGSKNSAIKQYVKMTGNTGDVVNVSGWGKGLNIGDRSGHQVGVFWVQAWIHYADGTTQFDVLKKFPKGTYDFMLAEASFAALKPFTGITVFCRFDGTGEAWFDEISLSVTPSI